MDGRKNSSNESKIMAKKKVEDVLDEAITESRETKLPSPDLSMGYDLYNLAISGNAYQAVGPGRYVWLHGESSSGKSFLTLGTLAEAARNPAYDGYDLIYVDAELGAAFDVPRFFGPKLAARLDRMEDVVSIERFYDRLETRTKPFIAVLDSFDALLPEERIKEMAAEMKQRAENKDVSGSYKMQGPKLHSERLRTLVAHLGKTGSIFIGISQVRDNVGGGLYEAKEKVSGGRSLKFWASVEIATKCSGKMKKKIDGTDREVGSYVTVGVKKNRISGKDRTVKLVFVPGYGIDNTGSSIDWLLDEGYIPQAGGRITFPGYEKSYYREELIQKIEADDREPDLRKLLQESWNDLEDKLRLERKARW
jgi:RecA/RadA recombinase